MFPTTMTLLANPLKIHFLEYCQTNISLTSSQFQLILSLLALFSFFLPSTNKSLFEKCNFLLSLMINNSSMNRIPISNSTYVQISCAKYIPLLCRIWPTTPAEKFLVLPTKSWNDTNTCSKFTIFLDSPYSLYDQDQSYSSANYIHCSAKLSVNFHNSQFKTVLSFVHVSSVAELSDVFVEGRSLE